MCSLANGTDIGYRQFHRNSAAHGFPGGMPLHFFHTFDQLVEVLFIHG